MSKTKNKYEPSYCVTRKELLAVINALKDFNSYLYGQEILLSTDNSAVSWVKNLKNPIGLVARWLQEFGNLNFTITHRPGRNHSNADALSVQESLQGFPKARKWKWTGILPTQLRDGNVRATTSGQTKVNYPETNLREVQFLLDGWEANTTEQKQQEDLMLAKEDGTRPSWNLFLTSLEIWKPCWGIGIGCN